MRYTTISAIVAFVLFIGVAGASGPIPDADDPMIYLHCENDEGDAGELWMNALDADNDSASSNHQSPWHIGSPPPTVEYNFPVRTGPNATSGLNRSMYFEEDNSTAPFHIRLQHSQSQPNEVVFTLREDGTVIDQQTLMYNSGGTYEGSFEVPGGEVIEQGSTLWLDIEWQSDNGQADWTLYMNTDSYLTLPFATDSDNDGIPDSQDDDNNTGGVNPPEPVDQGDKDDEGDDGLPGFEAPMFAVSAVAVVILTRKRSL